MKHIILTTCAFFMAASTAQAACYADYKAKQDDPLRLHYGVIELNTECDIDAAATEVAERLSETDWHLLNVVSVFQDDGLSEREASAGKFFLRY